MLHQFFGFASEGGAELDLPRHLGRAFDRWALLPRLAVLAVLLIGALFDQSFDHGASHWIVLAVYGFSTLCVAWMSSFGCVHRWLPLAGTVLDAAIAVYVIVEHLPADLNEAHHASDALSLFPALLFLLQNGLRLRESLVLLFAALVVAGWGVSISLLVSSSGDLPSTDGGAAFINRQAQSFAAFIAATLFVLGAVYWMRSATAAAWREKEDRLLISRFLPKGAGDVVRGGDAAKIVERHVCILSVDIRGYSALVRKYPTTCTVSWLLSFRSIVHDAVSWRGGVVDKYLGDGVLALFLKGEPAQQADDALAAARFIAGQLQAANLERLERGEPPLRTITTLHCGDVLAGVFDDGHRAEFTVLGPPMNVLPRIERRAKAAGVDIVASLAFLATLPALVRSGLGCEGITTDELDVPKLVAVMLQPHAELPKNEVTISKPRPDWRKFVSDAGFGSALRAVSVHLATNPYRAAHSDEDAMMHHSMPSESHLVTNRSA